MLRFSISAAAAISSALLLLPSAAFSQAYQCRVPQGPVSVPPVARDGPVRRVPITGYTLALSWSPEYCRARAGRTADDRQCSGRFGRFGFVVHGLWPEGRGTAWPQWCPSPHRLTGRELARHLCMTPSEMLLANEWAKHGACMTPRPERYFERARTLWASLRWPDFDRLARREDLTAGRIREEFAQANPRWEPENLGLVLNERGWLQELRLCYDKGFRPSACEARHFGPADSARVKIWRGL